MSDRVGNDGVGNDGDIRVVVVTDPMCAWCWGMSPAVEEAAAALSGEVSFDLLLAGVNTRARAPVGQYARRLFLHVWREVHATTGQTFAFQVPDGLVYNSTRPCLAVAAVRRALDRPPFGYLHRLQQLLFAEARDINDPGLLAATATDFGVSAETVRQGFEDQSLRSTVRAGFACSRSYGTSALPHVLIERDGERTLLAGGYADATTLETMVREAISRGSSGR